MEELAKFDCHYDFIDMAILDVGRKLIAAILRGEEKVQNNLSLFVLNNWETGEKFSINCNTAYVSVSTN